jgi:outer membrane receptor for ferrienterochelin and colicin
LQYEAFSKFALLFPETPYRGLGLITNYRVNSYQISNFHKNYIGNERYVYIQLIYQDIILNTNHTYKTGISYINNMLSEYFIGNPYNRIESVPGIFFEYTYNGKRISVISGVRYDKHNLMGDMITPRLHIKYELPYNWQARLIVGTGQRLANIFTENPSVVASARKVYFNQYIQPEKAVNSGVCLLKSYSIADNNGTLSVDYFYTYFFKQSVADLEQGVQTVYIKSVNNKGQAHAAQVEVNQEITKNFDFRLAYKWYNVLSEYGNVINTRPFIPSNRALINVAYSSLFDIWKFDITAKYFSSSRLPSTQQNPHFYQRSLSSPDYYIFNFQVTKAFKKYDVYVGCENVLNYMQPNPIVASDNPFSVYYDASMIWGPVMGRIIYAGLRLSIK